jgi:release factor glutamine methyltransferase
MRAEDFRATMNAMSTTTPDINGRIEQSMVFGHLPIVFDHRVLRPRPWTVAQSRWAAELMRTTPGITRVLELCAGAGHIGLLALAMADAIPVQLVTVDVNPVACELTRRNAASAGLGERVDIREGPIDAVLEPDERFDLVIADPPWVARSQTERYPDDPLVAIDGGSDGLEVARACVQASESHLVPGGSVVLQLGSSDQALQIREHLRATDSMLSAPEVRSFGTHGVLLRLTAGGL